MGLALCILSSIPACKRFQTSVARLAAADVDAAAYAKQCTDKGVPLPDHPVGDKKYWPVAREVDPKFEHFATFGKEGTKLFVHEEDGHKGCVVAVGESVGAICWSAAGDTCFWEDLHAPAGVLADPQVAAYTVARAEKAHVLSGDAFDPCTRCHRGDNPFVGHGSKDYGNAGDPAFIDFPDAKFTNLIVPPEWPKNEPGPAAVQCAGSCHTVADPTDGYCGIATRMMAAGLMLGRRFGVKPIVGEFEAPRPAPATQPLDAAASAQCTKYIAFLRACDALPKDDSDFFDSRSGQRYALNADNLGICAPLAEPRAGD